MPIETSTITLSDGRDLCVESFGDPKGPAIVFLSGTYEGRTLYPGLVEWAKERGLFVLGYDRPGYGGSTPKPGRVIADCATDLISIADHFHVNKLFTMGFSGGGSHSVASAVLLPELVGAAVAFCPIRPTEKASFGKALPIDRAEVVAYAHNERDEILATDHAKMIEANLNFSEKERVSLAFLEFHYGSMKVALQPGIAGCAEDLEAYYNPWELDLALNRVPIKIWHGKADVTVPYAHGEWLAVNTPHTELQLTESDSHRSIFENRFEAAMDWLSNFW